MWATESRQAYDDLIDSMTQMLQPRDLMELIWTKEATDARWEASRASREKNSLPERKYQQRLQTEAQYRRLRGAAEAPVTKPATALDHSRGLEASFKFYQGEQKRRPLSKGDAAMPRPKSKRPFTGRLLKPIDRREAKARGLRAQLALPPDESDLQAHVRGEIEARIPELNKFLDLPPDNRDLERLAKALVEREFGIPRDAPDWWPAFLAYLIRTRVPGFRVGNTGVKRHGAPQKWTHEQLMQLFADVQSRKKKKTGQSVVNICKRLSTTKEYEKRWGERSPDALRKAYGMANKLCREDSLFLLELCGAEALMRTHRGDLIQNAIERHALQL